MASAERPVTHGVMTNPRAERVKKVAQLTGRSAVRTKRGQFLAEGPQSVREAMRAHLGQIPGTQNGTLPWVPGHVIDQLYWTPELEHQDPELFDLVESVMHGGGVFGSAASHEVLNAMGDAVTAQQLVAVCSLPEPPTEETRAEDQLTVVLCRVQDPGNVGTIIRVADAAGVDRVYLTTGSADIYNPKTVRSTAGSLFHVPVIPGVSLEDLVTHEREHGRTVLAADGYGAVSLPDADDIIRQPATWLMGNEAQGLNESELALADHRVAVPLYGQAESLNVATAATVCLYASALAQRHGSTN